MGAVKLKPMGGTEIMVAGWMRHLEDHLERVSLGVNCLPNDRTCPVICWIHHDVNQPAVQWLRDESLHSEVEAFAFVSHWQRERFHAEFNVPRERSHVMRNAVEWRQDVTTRTGRRFAYTSTPFRGLDVLLEAWHRAEMSEDAELHIYSSMGLYGMADDPYEKLYARARAMPGVTYHGLKSNTEVRDALTGMDFLAYPATWQETSCLSVIEAMAAGMQVICPALGALPETTAGFAALCRFMPDKNAYADHFAGLLRAAIPGCSPLQVPYSRMMYGWDCRAIEWRKLIEGLT